MVNFHITSERDYPHIGSLSLFAFCSYVIIWYLQIGYRMPSLGEIRFEFIYAAVLSLIALTEFAKNPVELDCPPLKWTYLLFIIMFIHVLFSSNFEYSWGIFIDRVIKFSFMAVFIICFVRSPSSLMFFIGAFLLSCLKMGQEGFIGQITGGLVWENQGVMRLHGSTPLYAHPNSFSGMALGCVPFILYFFPIVPRVIKGIFIIQLLFAFNIILHTGSRTGYVAFIFMILFLVFKSKRKTLLIIVITIFAIISIQIIEKEYINRFMTIYTGQEIEGRSMDTRLTIIEDAVQVFLKHPFGVGVGAFPYVREEYFGRSQDTHNLYLEVATNLGVHGLIVFLLFISSMISSLKRTILLARDRREQLQVLLETAGSKNKYLKKFVKDVNIIEATANAVLLFILVRLALGMFGMDLYEIYWWFSLGLVVSLHNMIKFISLKIDE